LENWDAVPIPGGCPGSTVAAAAAEAAAAVVAMVVADNHHGHMAVVAALDSAPLEVVVAVVLRDAGSLAAADVADVADARSTTVEVVGEVDSIRPWV
jgi:hypothetical protein